ASETASARAEECPDDLVEHAFTAPDPNCVWVADIAYVPTQAEWVYTTFILDLFHREIVGWQVTNHMRESLARDALTMSLAAKYRAGEDVSGLIRHSDRGVQFRSIRTARPWRNPRSWRLWGHVETRTTMPWPRL